MKKTETQLVQLVGDLKKDAATGTKGDKDIAVRNHPNFEKMLEVVHKLNNPK